MTSTRLLTLTALLVTTTVVLAQDKTPPAAPPVKKRPVEVQPGDLKEAEADKGKKAETKKPEPKATPEPAKEPLVPAVKPPVTKGEAPVVPLRDPTAPSSVFRRANLGGSGTRLRSTQIPEIKLKGRLILKGKEPAALIEVEGKILLVKKGSEITLTKGSAVFRRPTTNTRSTNGAAGARATGRSTTLANLVLKVIKLDAQDVHFEVKATQQTLIIR